MKDSFKIILLLIVLIAVNTIVSLGIWYDRHQKSNVLPKDTVVNVQTDSLVSIIEQTTNPKMSSVDDVMQFRQRIVDEKTTDSTFTAIPTDILIPIARVVIGNKGHTTKNDIVQEFRKNYKPVYQHLRMENSNNKQDTLKSPPEEDTITIAGRKYVKLK